MSNTMFDAREALIPGSAYDRVNPQNGGKDNIKMPMLWRNQGVKFPRDRPKKSYNVCILFFSYKVRDSIRIVLCVMISWAS